MPDSWKIGKGVYNQVSGLAHDLEGRPLDTDWGQQLALLLAEVVFYDPAGIAQVRTNQKGQDCQIVNQGIGLPWWLSDKGIHLPMQKTRVRFLGRSPGEGNGNPLRYSCLGKPVERGAWQGYSSWGHKVLDRIQQLNNNKAWGLLEDTQ